MIAHAPNVAWRNRRPASAQGVGFPRARHVHRPVLRRHSGSRRRCRSRLADAAHLRIGAIHGARSFRRRHGRRTHGWLDHGHFVEHAGLGTQCRNGDRRLSAGTARQSGSGHRGSGERERHRRHHRHGLGARDPSHRQGHRSAVRAAGVLPPCDPGPCDRLHHLAREIAPWPDHRRVRSDGRVHRLQRRIGR